MWDVGWFLLRRSVYYVRVYALFLYKHKAYKHTEAQMFKKISIY